MPMFQPMVGQPQNQVSPISTPENQSYKMLFNAGENLLKVGASLGSSGNELTEAEKERQAMAPYAEEAIKITDAYEQGIITQREAIARIDSLTANSVSNTPTRTASILEMANKFKDTAGLPTNKELYNKQDTLATTIASERRAAERQRTDLMLGAVKDAGINIASIIDEDGVPNQDALVFYYKQAIEVNSLRNNADRRNKEYSEFLSQKSSEASIDKDRLAAEESLYKQNIVKSDNALFTKGASFTDLNNKAGYELFNDLATIIATSDTSLSPFQQNKLNSIIHNATFAAREAATGIQDDGKRSELLRQAKDFEDTARALVSNDEYRKNLKATNEMIAQKYNLNPAVIAPTLFALGNTMGIFGTSNLKITGDVTQAFEQINKVFNNPAFRQAMATDFKNIQDEGERLRLAFTRTLPILDADFEAIRQLDITEVAPNAAKNMNDNYMWSQDTKGAQNSAATFWFKLDESKSLENRINGMAYVNRNGINALRATIGSGDEKSNAIADLAMNSYIGTLGMLRDKGWSVTHTSTVRGIPVEQPRNKSGIYFDTDTMTYGANVAIPEAIRTVDALNKGLDMWVSLKGAHQGFKDLRDEDIRKFIPAMMGVPLVGTKANEVNDAIGSIKIPLREALFVDPNTTPATMMNNILEQLDVLYTPRVPEQQQ